MSDHGYETGRLNLPFVGVSTFAKRELVTDWSQINADAAVLGAPFDFGTQWRAGARFGPRGIREASTLFSFGHSGAYDHILQIDAHLDFVDIRHGVKYGHGNPMRRAAEKSYVTGLTQVGIRNVSSTAKEGYDSAKAMNSDILSVRQTRKIGPKKLVGRIPKDAKVYVTIDIDAFCPSIAPGTGTPSHGGFLYYDVLEILQYLAKQNKVVGIDLVEVAPDYDHSGSTTILAAQLLLNFLGFIFHNQK